MSFLLWFSFIFIISGLSIHAEAYPEGADTSDVTGDANGSADSSSTPAQDKEICKESGGMYKVPDDCTKFYHCQDYRPFQKLCQKSGNGPNDFLHFSEERKVCDWPHLANCTQTAK